MPNLLAMSFEGELAPSFDLRCLSQGEVPPDGWGIGYYPGGEPAAALLKEPAPPNGSIRSELIKAWEHLESSIFLLHVRRATWGAISDANTQPFLRAWGKREWLFGHAGSLRARLELRAGAPFEPVGATDTELIFCELMNRFAERGWKSLGEADPQILLEWLGRINESGNLTCVLTDGHDVAVYSDRESAGIWMWEVLPPYDRLTFGDTELLVDLGKRGVKSRKGVIVSSHPLQVNGEEQEWRAVPPGHLVMLRQGAVRDVIAPLVIPQGHPALPGTARRQMPRPAKAEPRRYRVTHRTSYQYDKPIERSSHVFKLFPASDRLQRLISHDLSVSVEGHYRDYDDVFGNRARRMDVETAYDQMTIVATSQVEVLDTDPLSYRPLHQRAQIPVVWMPWHQQVLQPFLLPPELAETELKELSEYAMSFAVRNDFDLLDTLLDLNLSIFQEYKYTPAGLIGAFFLPWGTVGINVLLGADKPKLSFRITWAVVAVNAVFSYFFIKATRRQRRRDGDRNHIPGRRCSHHVLRQIRRPPLYLAGNLLQARRCCKFRESHETIMICAHYLSKYLATTLNWLHVILRPADSYEPVMLARTTSNLGDFPMKNLYALSDLDRFSRLYNLAVYKTLGVSSSVLRGRQRSRRRSSPRSSRLRRL